MCRKWPSCPMLILRRSIILALLCLVLMLVVIRQSVVQLKIAALTTVNVVEPSLLLSTLATRRQLHVVSEHPQERAALLAMLRRRRSRVPRVQEGRGVEIFEWTPEGDSCLDILDPPAADKLCPVTLPKSSKGQMDDQIYFCRAIHPCALYSRGRWGTALNRTQLEIEARTILESLPIRAAAGKMRVHDSTNHHHTVQPSMVGVRGVAFLRDIEYDVSVQGWRWRVDGRALPLSHPNPVASRGQAANDSDSALPSFPWLHNSPYQMLSLLLSLTSPSDLHVASSTPAPAGGSFNAASRRRGSALLLFHGDSMVRQLLMRLVHYLRYGGGDLILDVDALSSSAPSEGERGWRLRRKTVNSRRGSPENITGVSGVSGEEDGPIARAPFFESAVRDDLLYTVYEKGDALIRCPAPPEGELSENGRNRNRTKEEDELANIDRCWGLDGQGSEGASTTTALGQPLLRILFLWDPYTANPRPEIRTLTMQDGYLEMDPVANPSSPRIFKSGNIEIPIDPEKRERFCKTKAAKAFQLCEKSTAGAADATSTWPSSSPTGRGVVGHLLRHQLQQQLLANEPSTGVHVALQVSGFMYWEKRIDRGFLHHLARPGRTHKENRTRTRPAVRYLATVPEMVASWKDDIAKRLGWHPPPAGHGLAPEVGGLGRPMSASERTSLSLAWQPSTPDHTEQRNRAGGGGGGGGGGGRSGKHVDMEEDEELDDEVPAMNTTRSILAGNTTEHQPSPAAAPSAASASPYSIYWNKLIQRKNSELQAAYRQRAAAAKSYGVGTDGDTAFQLLPLHLLSTVYPFPRGDKKHFSCRVRPVNNLMRDRLKVYSQERESTPEALHSNVTRNEPYEPKHDEAKRNLQAPKNTRKKAKPNLVPQSWVAVGNEDGTGCDDYANLAALQWLVTDAADRLYSSPRR